MWYSSNIQVKQLDTFYEQVDTAGNLKASDNIEGPNKIDRNTYTFTANLGEVFYTMEKNKPEIGDRRYVYDIEFEPTRVEKIGIWPFIKYRISWTSRRLDTYEDIAKFYKQNMWKQLPSGISLKAVDARKDI